jgi:hypothetical protein
VIGGAEDAFESVRVDKADLAALGLSPEAPSAEVAAGSLL